MADRRKRFRRDELIREIIALWPFHFDARGIVGIHATPVSLRRRVVVIEAD